MGTQPIQKCKENRRKAIKIRKKIEIEILVDEII